jgi:ATP-dependent Lon protease
MPNEIEITMPEVVPVMTLPRMTLFPQALMPLHIFENRYRRMLSDVLAHDRLFAVAGLNPGLADEGADRIEPPHRIACVGLVRTCQQNLNGTSNLLLQGLCRIEIVGIASEQPYRRIRIRTLASKPGAAAPENTRKRAELGKLLLLKLRLMAKSGKNLATFLNTIDDPETFIDVAASTLCENPELKQRLLETLDVHRRFEIFNGSLRSEIEALRVQRILQGGLPDDKIGSN